MIYTFGGTGNPIVRFEVDENRNMKIASQKTGNILVPLKVLFKPDKIAELNMKVNKMSQDEFNDYIILEFSKMGYRFVSKDG